MKEKLALYYRRLALDGCRYWYDYLLMLVLMPCGYLYACITDIRVWLYQRGVFSSSRAHVPVICVGNLVAGGTGKTPVVSWILDYTRQQGYRAAVISRGYASDPALHSRKLSEEQAKARRVDIKAAGGNVRAARIYGDEPVLLASRHPESIVVVAPQRADGVRYIQNHHDVDLIILDDAFQHLALRRDLDLVLLDARRPLGNGHVIPAGLMRERRSALKRADMLLMTRYDPEAGIPVVYPETADSKPIIHVSYRLAGYAIDLNGARISLTDLSDMNLCAFAGIADPDDFFASLHRYGIHPVCAVPFEDHATYNAQRMEYILAACNGADALITTEKDAVKLDPESLSLPCYYVPLEIDPVEQVTFRQMLSKTLEVPESL